MGLPVASLLIPDSGGRHQLRRESPRQVAKRVAGLDRRRYHRELTSPSVRCVVPAPADSYGDLQGHVQGVRRGHLAAYQGVQ